MKTQIQNEDFNQLQNLLISFGWTCEKVDPPENQSDFWTTFETDCPEDEFELFLEDIE